MKADIAKKAFFLCLLVLAYGVGQGIQFSKSYEDVNYSALARWAAGDAVRLQRAEQFDVTCVKSVKSSQESITKPLTLRQCAQDNQLEDVLAIYLQTDNTLKTIAWPLSIVVASSD